MEMIPVASSLIESIGYEGESRKLLIKFCSGPTYSYEEVSREVYDELMNAGSVGRFFLKEIKGVYPSKKQETA
jgi:hypothetical protein